MGSKWAILIAGLLTLSSSVQAGEWVDLKGGQGTLVVVDTRVDVNENNIPTCLFHVAISSDFMFDASEVSAVGLIEAATYVDEECYLKKGNKILTTVNVKASSTDLTNPATFFISTLGAGYESEIMFPNYGK